MELGVEPVDRVLVTPLGMILYGDGDLVKGVGVLRRREGRRLAGGEPLDPGPQLEDRLQVLSGVLRNTRNTGYANALAALEAGAAALDTSAGGIGGCPFAPAATGNIATEDLLYLLHCSGVTTGADLPGVLAAAGLIEAELGERLPAQLGRAGIWPATGP